MPNSDQPHCIATLSCSTTTNATFPHAVPSISVPTLNSYSYSHTYCVRQALVKNISNEPTFHGGVLDHCHPCRGCPFPLSEFHWRFGASNDGPNLPTKFLPQTSSTHPALGCIDDRNFSFLRQPGIERVTLIDIVHTPTGWHLGLGASYLNLSHMV